MYGLKENINIKDMILEIRGKQVLLDSDLAKLYNVETKRINEAVKNNPDKFPERYIFRISENEYLSLKSKNSTSKGGSRKGHTVFTEQGVYMLATILKTKIAIEVTIKIMDTFVAMRKLINENNDILKRVIKIENKTDYINNTVLEHENKINELFNRFNKKEEFKNKLFFNGEIYDAYSILIDIISKADKKIIIIDNYVDKTTLDILSKKKINVTILLITDKSKNKLTKTDIDKFNKEYPKLKVRYTNIFHDRFIIIDSKELYHLGASLKDLGNKVFGINIIKDVTIINSLLEKI